MCKLLLLPHTCFHDEHVVIRVSCTLNIIKKMLISYVTRSFSTKINHTESTRRSHSQQHFHRWDPSCWSLSLCLEYLAYSGFPLTLRHHYLPWNKCGEYTFHCFLHNYYTLVVVKAGMMMYCIIRFRNVNTRWWCIKVALTANSRPMCILGNTTYLSMVPLGMRLVSGVFVHRWWCTCAFLCVFVIMSPLLPCQATSDTVIHAIISRVVVGMRSFVDPWLTVWTCICFLLTSSSSTNQHLLC